MRQNLIKRQGVHTVYYVSVHLLSCHLRLLTDLCGEVLLGHLLCLPALGDQFAHIHVNLEVCDWKHHELIARVFLPPKNMI